MRKYPVTWFYILAFGISWLGMISAVLGSRGIAPFYNPLLPDSFHLLCHWSRSCGFNCVTGAHMVRQGFGICSRDLSDGGLV